MFEPNDRTEAIWIELARLESDANVAERLRELILLGADPSAQTSNNSGWRPLHVLAQQGRPKSIAAILSCGVSALEEDCYGWFPIFYSLQNVHFNECADLLFDAMEAECTEDPELLHASLVFGLVHCRRTDAQDYLLEKMGRTIEMALESDRFEVAEQLMVATLETLREKEPEVVRDLFSRWRENAQSHVAVQYFVSEARARFEYEGARFSAALTDHFNAAPEAPVLPRTHERPTVSIGGLLDYPAA